MSAPDLSALSYANDQAAHFAQKAKHNKRESLTSFTLVIVSTLSVSALLAIGRGDEWIGRVLPLCLSLLASGLSTWLQFRKPHQLWGLYRTAQRQIEHEIARYKFGVGEYGGSAHKDRLLADRVSNIKLAAHERWLPLIPSPEGLQRVTEPRERDHQAEAHHADGKPADGKPADGKPADGVVTPKD